MSQSENGENLLIDFNNLTMSNGPSDDMDRKKNSTVTQTLPNCTSSNAAKNQILCASQPLYKLLAESNDVDANNPFDYFDEQARLLDDPFAVVEKAALISAISVAANTIAPEVKMASLITIDSIISDTSKGVLSSICSQTTLCNETKLNDSVQNAPQKQMSATELISQKSVSSSSSQSSSGNSITVKNSSSTSSYDTFQKELEVSRNLGKNDLFDDIWSTIPNFIDSQTEIYAENDTDIADLNIPMLKHAVPNSYCKDYAAADPIGSDNRESIEVKALNRSDLLKKLASIKKKMPASIDDIHSGSQLIENHVQHQQEQYITPNPDSLIKSLQKFVNQCDDKHKQMTAKYLLDNLSSILTKTKKKTKTDDKNRQPSKILRRRPLSGKMKTSYGIPKKSVIPPASKSNLKTRVSQSITGQSRAQRTVNESRRTPSFI